MDCVTIKNIKNINIYVSCQGVYCYKIKSGIDSSFMKILAIFFFDNNLDSIGLTFP